MNWPHIHLMLNHAQVMGVLLALALLLIGIFRESSPLKEAALITLVLTGALAAVVYYTGDAAGELIGSLPGISEADLRAHSSMALYALAGAATSGLSAILALAFSRRSGIAGLWLLALSLLLAAVTAFLMGWTANLGGRMRHPEARKPVALGDRQPEHLGGFAVLSLNEWTTTDGGVDLPGGAYQALEGKNGPEFSL